MPLNSVSPVLLQTRCCLLIRLLTPVRLCTIRCLVHHFLANSLPAYCCKHNPLTDQLLTHPPALLLARTYALAHRPYRVRVHACFSPRCAPDPIPAPPMCLSTLCRLAQKFLNCCPIWCLLYVCIGASQISSCPTHYLCACVRLVFTNMLLVHLLCNTGPPDRHS